MTIEFIKDVSGLPISFKNDFDEVGNQAFSFHSEKNTKDYGRRSRDFCFGFVIAYNGDKAIGISELYYGSSCVNKKIIAVGGMSGVAVKPEFQKQGIGSQIIEYSIKVLRDYEVDLIFIYTDPDVNSWRNKLYSKFGFSNLPGQYIFMGKDGLKHAENDGMIAPGVNDQIFKFLLDYKEDLHLNAGRW
jgi:predicted N-acetyltransferase YhbS